MSVDVVSQCLLKRFHRQKQTEFVRRQADEPKLLIVALCVGILCIDEHAYSTCRVEDVEEPFHRRDEQHFTDTLPLVTFGHGKSAKTDARDFAREPPGFGG